MNNGICSAPSTDLTFPVTVIPDRDLHTLLVVTRACIGINYNWYNSDTLNAVETQNSFDVELALIWNNFDVEQCVNFTH